MRIGICIGTYRNRRVHYKSEDSAVHFMYRSLFSVKILADDFASRKSPPTSLISSTVIDVRPLILAVRLAGVSSCTAYLYGNWCQVIFNMINIKENNKLGVGK